jgi:hypothetical protein
MDEPRIVSAYHNYLVDGKLEAEFRVESQGGFFFQAHRLNPGDQLPVVSGRFFDPRGEFLLEVRRNVLAENPHGFSLLEMAKGWAMVSMDLEAILSAQILEFSRGLVSVIRGTLYDGEGRKVLFGDELGLHLTDGCLARRVPVPGLRLQGACAWP